MFRRRRSPFRRSRSSDPRLALVVAVGALLALGYGVFHFAGVADRAAPERAEVRVEIDHAQ